MTIQEAYNKWAQQSGNRQFAASTARQWRTVWSQLNSQLQCADITIRKLVNAVGRLRFADLKDRVCAASVMVHVLRYAHTVSPDENPEPPFTFDDIVQHYEGRAPRVLRSTHSQASSAPSEECSQQPEPKKRKKRKPVPSRRVLCYGRDGSNVIHNSARELAEHYGTTTDSVRSYIWHKKPFHDMMLTYEGDPKPEFPAVTHRTFVNGYTKGTKKPKPVTIMQFAANGDMVMRKQCESKAEVAQLFDVSTKHVANHIYNNKPLRSYYVCYTNEEKTAVEKIKNQFTK